MNSKKIKLVLAIITLLVLVVICTTFVLNQSKNKKLIKYVEDLLEIRLNKYVSSATGKITLDENDINRGNIKIKIKSYLINDFKKELDGKMNMYELSSDIYINEYKRLAKFYAGDMMIDTFYQLSTENKNIMGILCENNGQYYFLLIG